MRQGNDDPSGGDATKTPDEPTSPASARRFLEVERLSGCLLLLAAVVALAWANSPWAASYEALWRHAIRPFGARSGVGFPSGSALALAKLGIVAGSTLAAAAGVVLGCRLSPRGAGERGGTVRKSHRGSL